MEFISSSLWAFLFFMSFLANIGLVVVLFFMWKALAVTETLRDGVAVTKTLTATFMKK